MIYYSKTTKGFYCDEIHGTNIPSDCVQITKEQHTNLLNEQSQGKQIVPDENGYPITIVPPVIPPTWEQIRAKRDFLLKDSDWSVAGDATPKPSKEAWLTYRQALRDIPQNFEDPSEVIWPNKPE
jgi:hypothetical protein